MDIDNFYLYSERFSTYFNRVGEPYYEGKDKYIFVFNEPALCLLADWAGYTPMYIGTPDEMDKMEDIIGSVNMESNNCILVCCCVKWITKRLKALVEDNRIINGCGHNKILTAEKDADYYKLQDHENEFIDRLNDFVDNLEGKKDKEEVTTSVLPKMRTFDEIEEEGVEWLWYPYIPRGKITILFAAPGAGKTYLTCWLASQISKGNELPGAPPIEWEKPCQGKVMLFNAEDMPEDTLKVRLRSLGADQSQIIAPENWGQEGFVPFSLTDPRLDAVFEEVKPVLVIFDPMQAYLGAELDMNRANHIRAVLAYIGSLAKKHNFALVIVAHINKMSTQYIGDRVIGSQDIKAAARSMLFLGQHPREPRTKVLFQTKNNLEEFGENLAFSFKESMTGGYFRSLYQYDTDIDVSELKPEDCTGDKSQCKAKNKSQLAKQLIEEVFQDKLSISVKELQQLAVNNDISWNTFKRAKPENVTIKKVGFSGEFVWEMPPF